MPSAVGRYIAAKITRSVALTNSFQERITAATNPTNGRITAARVMLRWSRLMPLASQALPSSNTRRGNDRSADFHIIRMKLVTDRAHVQALSGIREELASPMRAALPALSDEVIAEIRDSVPEYAQPLEGRFGEAVRTGVGVALRRFVDDVERPGEDSEGWRSVYENLGRGEYRQGRTLEALLGAYRLGARVSWRRI